MSRNISGMWYVPFSMEIVLTVLAALALGSLVALGLLKVTHRYGGEPEEPDVAPPPKGVPLSLDGPGPVKVTEAGEKPEPGGFRIRHGTARSALVTVPVITRPLVHRGTGKPVPYACPTCRVAHTHKTLHLWVDDRGVVLVSAKVLGMLKEAGLENFDLVHEGYVAKPPPLKMGPGVRRDEIDQAGRKIIQYKSIQ
jgi:hypothetical protein